MQSNTLIIDPILRAFVEQELLPSTDISAVLFWQTLTDLLEKFTKKNQELLKIRDTLAQQINDWHEQNPVFNQQQYQAFLTKIAYIEPALDDFSICTDKVDNEISTIAGPQLVVPSDNARYAINAVNARWGNLYDALYGSDVINNSDELKHQGQYNPKRGEAVFKYSHDFLDKALPLTSANHNEVIAFSVEQGELNIHTKQGQTKLKNTKQWLGYQQDKQKLTSLVFNNNGLHIILEIDHNDTIGNYHPAGIKAVILESAITTILDLEDSVSIVDASDKVRAYQNLLGLMRGDLSVDVTKNNTTFKRQLNNDRYYQTPKADSKLCLSGRSLMLVRNTSIHTLTDMVQTAHKQSIPEGILDALVSGVFASYCLVNKQNSRQGSFYVVKPKLHGSKEVAFSVELFEHIEQAFGLPNNTIKLGIMDEERRTSVNLKACIQAAKARIVFVNTGFLDRTGDEIHTSMSAGAFVPKVQIKQQKWLKAYEEFNVKIALNCGFSGRGQIGKGMWPMPDRMQQMMTDKITHLKSGASCSWVPSPTAATLHAMHYHQVDVFAYQKQLSLSPKLEDLLSIPLLKKNHQLKPQEIQQELNNNIQSILGYVVHWINAGVGCSKVLDIDGIALMEDRATLRISSQHVGNWLHHGICSRQQVEQTFKRMASVVDAQNKNINDYLPLTPTSQAIEPLALQAAKALVYQAVTQENGYTEYTLNYYRQLSKPN